MFMGNSGRSSPVVSGALGGFSHAQFCQLWLYLPLCRGRHTGFLDHLGDRLTQAPNTVYTGTQWWVKHFLK